MSRLPITPLPPATKTLTPPAPANDAYCVDLSALSRLGRFGVGLSVQGASAPRAFALRPLLRPGLSAELAQAA